jgi:hypothetical protein
MQCRSALCSRKRDGICGNVIQSSQKHRLVSPLAEKEIMANVAKVILAAAIAAVSIASPALARSHHSAHHHFRIYNYSGGGGTSLVQEARRGDLWEGGGP